MDEVAPPVGLDETGVLENPQVLGHRARRDAQQVGQGPDAERPFGQKADDLRSLLHRERPEDSHHVLPIYLSHPF